MENHSENVQEKEVTLLPWLVSFTVLLLLAVFVLYGFSLEEPSTLTGAFVPQDNRQHRLEHLSYQQTQRVIGELASRRRKAKTNKERAFFSAKLADLFVERKMLDRAQKEIQEAYNLFPQQRDILARYLLILIHRKRFAKARHLLSLALQQHPRHPTFLRIQKMLP